MSFSFRLTCLSTEDVYESLWTRNKDVATAIWNLPFLQKMKSGQLPSNLYVNFMVQDILYLLEVSNMLKDISEYVKEPEDIRVFMESSYNSYNKYATDILEDLKFKVRTSSWTCTKTNLQLSPPVSSTGCPSDQSHSCCPELPPVLQRRHETA